MSDFTIFLEMKKAYENGEQLPEDFEKKYYAEMRKKWVYAVERGLEPEEELLLFDLSVEGGPCPRCGVQSIPDVSPVMLKGVKLGELTKYNPDCTCLSNSAKDKKMIEQLKERMVKSHIPLEYQNTSWQDWDHSVDSGINKAYEKSRSLVFNEGVKSFLGKGAVLMGKPGRGKTYCGINILRTIMANTSLKCIYEPMVDFTAKIISSGRDSTFIVDKMMKYDVIMLDDLDKLSTSSEWVQERVFSIIDASYREGKTVIVTTNLESIPEMNDFFGYHGEAIISRMVDRMSFVLFKGGEDYRKLRRLKNKT